MATKFSFLDLPRGIRDLIYDEVWKASPWTNHGSPTSEPVIMDPILRKLPSLLLTSKSVLDEGMTQLHRKPVCMWCFDLSLCPHQPYKAYAPHDCTVLPFCSHRALEFHLNVELRNANAADGALGTTWDLCHRPNSLCRLNSSMLRYMITGTAGHEGVTKIVLCLHLAATIFSAHGWSLPEAGKLAFNLDSPNLRTESFPCLRRLGFEVLYCVLGMREIDRQLLVAGLREETRRVALVALRGPSRKRAHWMWEGSRGLHTILEHDYRLV
jgi:hypothetical protein